MLLNEFPRLWFPPLTYYRADGSLDFDRMEQMLARVHPHCQGVLVPGSTGDGWILPEAEQEAIGPPLFEGLFLWPLPDVPGGAEAHGGGHEDGCRPLV